MNARILFVALQCLIAVRLAADTNSVAIYPEGDPLTPENYVIAWPSIPGVRYEVRQSTDLQAWTLRDGFPAVAEGPAQQMLFKAEDSARFFRVIELDDQAPTIVGQYPQDGAFAVPRFATMTLRLSDVTGIDTNSIQLTVGDLGTFTLGTPKLNFTNNVLAFDNGGSVALGSWGTNVETTLIVADTLGHRSTNRWAFTLEVQPSVVTNLFVFGSPHAQRNGQQIGDIPTAWLASRFGPIAMGGPDPWTIELVESNRLVLAYTETTPVFATNIYVCNLTPARPADIFNRRITAVVDDALTKRLTLFTVEVPLTELVTNGTASISRDSVLLETGPNGAFVKAFSVDGTVTFPRTGFSLDGTEFKLKDPATDFDLVKFTAEELHCWLTPRLQASLEIEWGGLKQFQAIASGNVSAATVLNADFLLAGLALEKTIFDLPEAAEPKTWMLLGVIGFVPVYATLGFDVQIKARAEVHGTLHFRAGLRQEFDAAVGASYSRSDVNWVRDFRFPPAEIVPFTGNINAEGLLRLAMEPQFEFLVYGLAGVSAGIKPSAALVFEAGTGEPLSGRLEAEVSLDLGLAGPAFDLLGPKFESDIPLWSDEWHLFPDEAVIAFTTQPGNQTVQDGSAANFSCSVAAPEIPTYQWYFNGGPLPGQRSRTLYFPRVTSSHAGAYRVRVTAGSQSLDSALAVLTVLPKGTPSGMVLIPAGSFTMGDTFNEGDTDEQPTHTVYVSAIHMDRYEVTKALWDDVYQWAITRGYSFDNAGLGKGANHPVHEVSWYDMVKWCNARSEKAGRVPAYYASAAQTTVYRTGRVSVQNDWVKWDRGYRLPTEAEWEKAARGGVSGRRFPWGDTITHSQANYSSSSSDAYDISPTRGPHPSYANGDPPYTSPVGSFGANGYGLYDMAGNVWEWCWDWHGPYAPETASDPRGPSASLTRVVRGGGLDSLAFNCRAANRIGRFPDNGYGAGGFRSVLPPGQ